MFCLNNFFYKANPYTLCTLLSSWLRGNKCILICYKTLWFRMIGILQSKFLVGLNAAYAVIYKRM